MMIGSNLFHMGILVLLVGHLVGLLTPINVFDTLGVGHDFKQMMALVVGGMAGIAAFVGCTLLLHRRLLDPRIRRSSSIGDIAVLVLIWLQLVLGSPPLTGRFSISTAARWSASWDGHRAS
jgi:nitrate reductase gamma subunit